MSRQQNPRGGFCGVRSPERAKARGSEDKLSENDSESEILVRVKQIPRERILRRVKHLACVEQDKRFTFYLFIFFL